jgi:hypothetical protein
VDFISSDYLSMDTLASAKFSGNTDQAWSFYSVPQSDANAAQATVMGLGTSAVTDRIDFLRRNSTTDWEVYVNDGSAAATESGGVPDISAHIISAISTGTSAQIHVDGVALTMSGGVDVGGMALASASMGAVEINNTMSQFWDGRIGEVAIFNGAHTTLQRKRQEFRLADMWGIDLVIT